MSRVSDILLLVQSFGSLSGRASCRMQSLAYSLGAFCSLEWNDYFFRILCKSSSHFSVPFGWSVFRRHFHDPASFEGSCIVDVLSLCSSDTPVSRDKGFWDGIFVCLCGTLLSLVSVDNLSLSYSPLLGLGFLANLLLLCPCTFPLFF